MTRRIGGSGASTSETSCSGLKPVAAINFCSSPPCRAILRQNELSQRADFGARGVDAREDSLASGMTRFINSGSAANAEDMKGDTAKKKGMPRKRTVCRIVSV